MNPKRSASFFSKIQEMPWYLDLLDPVLKEIGKSRRATNLLDIGCGPGKLIERVQDMFAIKCSGVDTNPWMIEQTRKKPELEGADFYISKPVKKLPLAESKFDVITFCSVLSLIVELTYANTRMTDLFWCYLLQLKEPVRQTWQT